MTNQQKTKPCHEWVMREGRHGHAGEQGDTANSVM